MSESENNFEEIKNDKSKSYTSRIRSTFLNAFIMITFGALVYLFVKGFSVEMIYPYVFLLVLALIYAMISVKQILHHIRFFYEQGKIELAVEKNNSRKILLFDKKEIKIIADQDLSAKLTVWRLKVQKNTGEIIIIQKDVAGWTKELFLEIETCYKKISTT